MNDFFPLINKKLTGMKRVNKPTTFQLLSRVWSGQSGVLAGKQAEEKMTSILRNKFPKAHTIEVNDISGMKIEPID